MEEEMEGSETMSRWDLLFSPLHRRAPYMMTVGGQIRSRWQSIIQSESQRGRGGGGGRRGRRGTWSGKRMWDVIRLDQTEELAGSLDAFTCARLSGASSPFVGTKCWHCTFLQANISTFLHFAKVDLFFTWLDHRGYYRFQYCFCSFNIHEFGLIRFGWQ